MAEAVLVREVQPVKTNVIGFLPDQCFRVAVDLINGIRIVTFGYEGKEYSLGYKDARRLINLLTEALDHQPVRRGQIKAGQFFKLKLDHGKFSVACMALREDNIHGLMSKHVTQFGDVGLSSNGGWVWRCKDFSGEFIEDE